MIANSTRPSGPLKFMLKLAAVATLALLQACGSSPSISTGATDPENQDDSPLESGKVNVALPSSDFRDAFSAADVALAKGDWMGASVALQPLRNVELERNDSDYLQYMLARIDYRQGKQRSAQQQLRTLERDDLHPGIRYRLLNFHRHLLDLDESYLESARVGVQLMKLAPEVDQAGLKRSIWLDLKRCSAEQLVAAQAEATDEVWRGWLALAAIENSNIQALATQLVNWQGNYPQHPASDPLPGGLQYLLLAPAEPVRVTLLLPLSGRLAPAGKAVRDGYLASYYRARQSGEAQATLQLIDSDLFGSATEAYNQAALQGAELIVGPLSKNAVAELASMTQRNVPVIALNRIDEAAAAAPAALVQMSLSPEDEARQLARRAFGGGARRALLLHPTGVWGDKVAVAFERQWRKLGGSVAKRMAYSGKDEYSDSVKAGLGIAESEQRQRQLRDMLAANVAFTPRRRQDVDAIIMLSRTPVEARAIKPLLAFHYAGALPVYAMSNIHGGIHNERDRDLNGTQITEIPWLLGSDPGLKQVLAASSSHQYARLHALGTDAYHLQSRLQQLQAGPDALIKGNTGLLTLNPKLQIEREVPAAVFDGDRLRPLSLHSPEGSAQGSAKREVSGRQF